MCCKKLNIACVQSTIKSYAQGEIHGNVFCFFHKAKVIQWKQTGPKQIFRREKFNLLMARIRLAIKFKSQQFIYKTVNRNIVGYLLVQEKLQNIRVSQLSKTNIRIYIVKNGISRATIL